MPGVTPPTPQPSQIMHEGTGIRSSLNRSLPISYLNLILIRILDSGELVGQPKETREPGPEQSKQPETTIGVTVMRCRFPPRVDDFHAQRREARGAPCTLWEVRALGVLRLSLAWGALAACAALFGPFLAWLHGVCSCYFRRTLRTSCGGRPALVVAGSVFRVFMSQ